MPRQRVDTRVGDLVSGLEIETAKRSARSKVVY